MEAMNLRASRSRARRAVAVVALGMAAAAALAGCSSTSAKAPETVYSAWVSNGTISSVRYDLVASDGSAETYSNTLARSTWSLSVNGGSKPSVTVRPSTGGTAHCVVSAPGAKRVLVQRSGGAGETVTCSTTR